MMVRIRNVASLLPFFVSTCLSKEFCKPIQGSPNWPDIDAWNALNSSVNGHLIKSVPLGAVCHPEWPQFDDETCAMIASQWSNTSFVSGVPDVVDYNDEACLPEANSSCSDAGYPAYTIEARDARDVQEGVRFAARTGVRLVVKSTGHDYPGRSSGPDSLSIWTHHLRGVEVNHGDPRATALGAVASVKIFAGEQIKNIYHAASEGNVTVMGGSDPTVGIAGWMSGGGHGPLTAKYGLGPDQVIEMEVVTADGYLRTVNADSNPDLFWALRGGGAGTFAVVISMTVKAYPPVSASVVLYSYNTTANSEAFWNLTAYFYSQIPHLMESGIYGYYFPTPIYPQETNSSIKGKIMGSWVAPGLSEKEARAILAPMEDHIRATDWGNGTKAFVSSVSGGSTDDFMAFWPSVTAQEAAGKSGRLGSRLLGNSSLLGDFDKLKNALRVAAGSPPVGIIGHLVAPAPNTRRPIGGIAGGDDAVLPAWRTAYTHVVLPSTWSPHNETQKRHETTQLRDVRVQALRDLEPEGGAYMSESDPTEPHWQKTKFGVHYSRLLEIKKKWDSKGVFWCKQCAGSELWETRGDFGIENGVGQNKVRLCKGRRRS